MIIEIPFVAGHSIFPEHIDSPTSRLNCGLTLKIKSDVNLGWMSTPFFYLGGYPQIVIIGN